MSEKETQQGNRFFGRALGWKAYPTTRSRNERYGL